MAQVESGFADVRAAACEYPSYSRPQQLQYSRHAVFEHCPQCGGDMSPEHAHFRCRGCGWRDSCCD